MRLAERKEYQRTTRMPVIQLADFRTFACETPSSQWSVQDQCLSQRVGFCDWVTMYQRHPGGNLRRFSDGAVLMIDRHGETKSMTLKRERFEGSHESAVMIRCDGETVEFSGNVSKFNRQDNVFGLTFDLCLSKINGILSSLDLPEFTSGSRYISNMNGNPALRWTGAKVTRLDITENFATGCREDASHFMRFLQGQQASRIKTGTFGDGETVDFGRGSRRLYFKVYSKGPELRRHGKGEYITKLADWADDVGLVRAELTLKSLKLADLGCSYLGGVNMKVIEAEFLDKCSVFTRAEAEVADLPELPSQVLGTLRMWENGDNVVAKLSRATYYRHRLLLLPFGIDISIRSNVVRMQARTRVIKLGPVTAPSFYQHDEELRYETYR
jgi:replication protein CRI/X family protein